MTIAQKHNGRMYENQATPESNYQILTKLLGLKINCV